MPSINLNLPSLLRVPDALRAPSPSTSFSSTSSYGFDQRSKTSQMSQSTDQTLITPHGSVDSIFGNNPRIESIPLFPDLLAWDGLTDEQWKLHSLVSKAECATKEAESGLLKDLDETFFRDDIWSDDDLYEPAEEFDAVAAVRDKLVKGVQTITTRRALEIIDTRCGIAPTITDRYDEHFMASKGVIVETEDYAEDFELGDDEVLEIHNNSGTHGFHHSVLEPIQEVDESREPDSLFNETFPSTPVIRPVDGVWNCPSFSTSDTSTSTPKYISQLLMSPLVLENSFANDGSPIFSISPFLFSKRRPLPASLLRKSLDTAAVVQLEVAASLCNSVNVDVPPRANINARQELGLGLGLVGVPSSMTQSAETWTRTDNVDSRSCAVPFIAKPPQWIGIFDNSRDPEHESLLQFVPELSPLDKMLEELGQRVVPYVPMTVGPSIPHTGTTSHIVVAAVNTVTAGSSHPAASTTFITPTKASRARKGIKGLGLGLPMGLKQRLSRCSSGIPTSEACQDLASLAAPVMANSHPRRYRGRMLSPIPEESTPRPDPCPIPEIRLMPSPTRQRNFFKRALKRLF